jgi:hypothetical protein
MSTPINGVGNAAQAADAARRTAQTSEAAATLIRESSQLGVLNAELLAKDLAKVVEHDPKRAADLLAEIKPQLSPQDQKLLAKELAEELDTRATQQLQQAADARAGDIAKQKQELALDLVQIGLSVAGIFDPTPISDGLDGLISVFRGDWLGAGISAVSMIPYIGDAAKLGKLGKFAESVAKAVDLAKLDPAFAKTIAPALDKIRDAVNAVPLDSLPKPAREALEKMKSKLDELAGATYKAPASPSAFRHGASDGGPGVWGAPPTGRNQLGVDYQRQISGAPSGTEYLVPLASRKTGVVAFDGYDASRKVLLDSKDFGKWPPSGPPFLRQQAIDKIGAEARDQLAAAKGTAVEWHFSDAKKANEVLDILQDLGIKATNKGPTSGAINVVVTPKP